MPLPRKSSRTSTQAISVPNSALTSTTITEAISVSRSAATACGLLTAFQNASEPAVERLEQHRRQRDQRDDAQVRHGDAAAEDVPGITDASGRGSPAPRAAGRAAAALVGGSALPLRLEDLGHDAALRIEELVVDLAPAAELA